MNDTHDKVDFPAGKDGQLVKLNKNGVKGWIKTLYDGRIDVEVLVDKKIVSTAVAEPAEVGSGSAIPKRWFTLRIPKSLLIDGGEVEARLKKTGDKLAPISRELRPKRSKLPKSKRKAKPRGLLEWARTAFATKKKPVERVREGQNRRRVAQARMKEAYTEVAADPSAIARWATFKQMAIIVGSMKSGTTSLHYCLARHPAMARNDYAKEPSFFDKWSQGKQKLPQLAKYFAQWRFDPTVHQYALEGSTNYTKYPHFSGVFPAMRESGLNFKFVYILRDPIDRLESHIRHSIAQRRFEEGDDPVSERHINVSSYAKQLDELTRVFPRESVLLVSFNDFVADPQKVSNQVFAFLGLPPIALEMPRPRNVRKVEWSLDAESRERAYRALRADAMRLHSEYGVDTKSWFKRMANYGL